MRLPVREHATHARLDGALTALAVVATSLIYRVFYVNFDLRYSADGYLAVPIAEKIADPAAFSPNDLIIRAGVEGPFHFYKLASIIFRMGWDFDAVWFVLYLCFFAGFVYAAWTLSLELTGNLLAAAVSTALAMTSPNLTLHWSQSPPLQLVTSTVAWPLVLLSLTLGFRGAAFGSLILAGLAFDIHPGLGVISFATSGGLLLFSGRFSGRELALPLLAGLLTALPNVAYIVFSGESAGTAQSAAEFMSVFRAHALHAFVDTHWREGYGYFFTTVASALIFLNVMPKVRQQPMRHAIYILVALPILYTFAVYLLQSRLLSLMFLFRTTVILKIIAMAILGHGYVCCLSSGIRGARLIALGLSALLHLLFLFVYNESFDVAGAACLGLIAAAMSTTRSGYVLSAIAGALALVGTFLFRSGLMEYSLRGLDTAYHAAFEVALAALSLAIGLLAPKLWPQCPVSLEVEARSPAGLAVTAFAPFVTIAAALALQSLAYRSVAPFQPRSIAEIGSQIRSGEPPARLRPVIAWVRANTQPGDLFVVPPHTALALGFRRFAKRGIYVDLSDINQLAYSPALYSEGNRRLQVLGITVEWTGSSRTVHYPAITEDRILILARTTAADYLIVRRSDPTDGPRHLIPEYQDAEYAVFSGEKLRALSGGS